jgi:hypothetical protein
MAAFFEKVMADPDIQAQMPKWEAVEESHEVELYMVMPQEKRDLETKEMHAQGGDKFMENLALKMKIAVLWLFMAVSMSAHSVLAFMEKEMVEQMWEMEMGPEMMLLMALFWWVPLVMAFLSLMLKGSSNRWTNMVLGIVFTILNIVHLTEHLAAASVHQILIIGSTVVATALIFWYAYKWPKEEV